MNTKQAAHLLSKVIIRDRDLRKLVEKWKDRAIDPEGHFTLPVRKTFEACAKELEEALTK